MDTRVVLQIILGVIITLILVLGGVMVVSLTGDAETIVVQEVAEERSERRERRSAWAEQGDAAIALVQRSRVRGEPGVEVDAERLTVGRLLDESQFIEEKLKITSGDATGWEAQWWGETSYGPTYFLVRYVFQDGAINVGPAWLVDLESQKVVPKNVLAEVVSNPERGIESDYYDQARQVVSAMTNHRFAAGINLGGALVRYFGGADIRRSDNKIVGWTVDHDRNELFQAYFQWEENGETTYAHFEFDFDRKALRAANLQAHGIMRIGEEFEAVDKVTIMPRSYDPSVRRPSARWRGGARRQCRQAAHRDGCKALATILDNQDLVETLEWVLTQSSESATQFARCQQPREGAPPLCRWRPVKEEDGVYTVHFEYFLGEVQEAEDQEPDQISWKVQLTNQQVEPVDLFSEVAYRAVHPRE